MTQDLKALRREITTEISGEIAGCFVITGGIPAHTPELIESALLRYAQACLRAEASDGMMKASTYCVSRPIIWNRMSEQRAREIES